MYFKPKREDGRSYRDVAVDMIKDRTPATIVTYKELGHVLDLHPSKNRNAIGMAVREANKVLLKLHKRGVKNVPQVGYRVLEAREHMIAANGHQTKADKAMSRALAFYSGADLAAMNEAERRLHHGQHMLAQAVAASHAHLDKRIRRIEDLLTGTQTVNQN